MEIEKLDIVENASSPFHILFPVCHERKEDVFQSVLRGILAHAKMDKNPLYTSLKAGMQARSLKIEAGDVGPWNNLHTHPEELRQAMMLGYWSSLHFPLLGKKLCGESWNAPQRQDIEISGSGSIKPEEFDSIIFGKLKIRVLELSMNDSTLQRLKNFPKAPNEISKLNRTEMSKKMVSFDIEESFLPQCWDALRCGSLTDRVSVTSNVSAPLLTKPNVEIGHSSYAISNIPKRRRRDTSVNVDGDNSMTDRLDNDQNRTSNNDTESLRTILVQMQGDIANITKWFNPVPDCEDVGSQRVYLKIISEKDAQIVKLKENVDDTRKEMEILKNQNSVLTEQAESNVGLISALQKGVDANFKLYQTSDIQANHLQDAINQQAQAIIAKDKELESASASVLELQNQVEVHQVESTRKITDLSDLLSQCKLFSETKENEIANAKAVERQLNINIGILQVQLTDSIANCEKLDQQIREQKLDITAKDKDVQEANTAVDWLKERVSTLNSNLEKLVPELNAQIGELEKKLSESIEKTGELEREVGDFKVRGDAKDKELESASASVLELKNQVEVHQRDHAESTRKITDLSDLLNQWNLFGETKENEIANAKAVERQLNINIGILQVQLTDSIANCEKLDQQIREQKLDITTKDKDVQEANTAVDWLKERVSTLNSNLEKLVPELNAQIGELEKKLRESIEKTGELERELGAFKAGGYVKDKELEYQLNCSNNNMPKSQTEGNLYVMTTEGTMAVEKTIREHQFKDPFEQNELQHRNDIFADVAGHNSEFNQCSMVVKVPLIMPNVDDSIVSKSSESVAVAVGAQNSNHQNESEVFESDDEIVRACRPILAAQRFGWVKFNASAAWPGFVFPPDDDGIVRAQRITPDGYVSDIKNAFVRFDESIPERNKGKQQLKALKKFNEKFHFAFV